jgi:hypothetical protein
MTPSKPLTDAHTLITTTDQPIADIAAGLGLSVDALDKRLARAYGKRARELRTGEAKRGRSPTGRETWRVRLTPEERTRVEELLEAGRAAGATTDGEALIKGLDLLGRETLLEAVAVYRAAAKPTPRKPKTRRLNLPARLRHDPTRSSAAPLEPPSAATAPPMPSVARPPAWALAEARLLAGSTAPEDFDAVAAHGGFSALKDLDVVAQATAWFAEQT